jgi:hypothetical protein
LDLLRRSRRGGEGREPLPPKQDLRDDKVALRAMNRFQVSQVFFCGSGFPAATIEAESLSHKKQNLLDDKAAPRAMNR